MADEQQTNENVAPPGSTESFNDFKGRVLGVVGDLSLDNEGHNTVVVTHSKVKGVVDGAEHAGWPEDGTIHMPTYEEAREKPPGGHEEVTIPQHVASYLHNLFFEPNPGVEKGIEMMNQKGEQLGQSFRDWASKAWTDPQQFAAENIGPGTIGAVKGGGGDIINFRRAANDNAPLHPSQEKDPGRAVLTDEAWKHLQDLDTFFEEKRKSLQSLRGEVTISNIENLKNLPEEEMELHRWRNLVDDPHLKQLYQDRIDELKRQRNIKWTDLPPDKPEGSFLMDQKEFDDIWEKATEGDDEPPNNMAAKQRVSPDDKVTMEVGGGKASMPKLSASDAADIKRMRNQGSTWKEIGDYIGFSRQRAHQLGVKLGLTGKTELIIGPYGPRKWTKEYGLPGSKKWLKEWGVPAAPEEHEEPGVKMVPGSNRDPLLEALKKNDTEE